MVTQEAQDTLKLYRFYKNNQLATAGGVLDQPAKYLDSMQTLERHLNREK
jgi:hypothetical protein